jgi:hypothetical protein
MMIIQINNSNKVLSAKVVKLAKLAKLAKCLKVVKHVKFAKLAKFDIPSPKNFPKKVSM